MKQHLEPANTRTSSLRNAMCKNPRLDAAIQLEPNRIVIWFSDGRTHCLDRMHHLATDQLIVAAVHWCRRHGANTVEIVT